MKGADDHEWNYNPRVHVPDHARHREWRQSASRAASAALPEPRQLRHGLDPAQQVDLFVPVDRPAHCRVALVHGGAWRAGDRADYGFAVPILLAAGAEAALVGYRLSPVASIDEALADVAAGLALLPADLPLILVGHSAGAQLAAAALEAPRAPLASALLVSGAFDLDAMLATSIGEDVLRGPDRPPPPPPRCPVYVVTGDRETPGFQAMSDSFARTLGQAGVRVHRVVIPGADHFSITAQLAHPETPLAALLLGLVAESAAR